MVSVEQVAALERGEAIVIVESRVETDSLI